MPRITPSRLAVFIHPRSVAIVLAASALAACGSSNSPTGPTNASVALAAHFDSLVVQAQNEDYYDLATALVYPTTVIAAGVMPASVSVQVDGSAQTFDAVAVDDVILDANTGDPTDSAYYIVAWQGNDVSQLFYVQYSDSDQIAEIDQIVGNNDEISTTQTIAANLGSLGNTCSFLDLASIYSIIQGATCTTANITASFSGSFPADEGVSTSVSFPSTSLPSLRVVETPTHVP